MAFILSKILGLMLSPVSWITIVFIVSLILFIRKRKIARIWFIASFSVFFVFSNPLFVNAVFYAWEKNWLKETPKEKYNYAIVLSGMVTWDSEYNRLNFGKSVDRVLQAAELYHSNRIDKIILSGGNASIITEQPPESILLKRFLLRINVPDTCIITEDKSRNTHENAVYTKIQIRKHLSGHPKSVLITSAYHMKRSLACFHKQKVDVTPCPVDFYVPQLKTDIKSLLLPSSEAFAKWEILLHEWFGILYYKIRGYM